MDGLPAERVQAALEELLGWAPLARSPQLARFLEYIVAARLRGDEAAIKAYAIAVDVFGRPASFDPQTDPIVRVQARRLRTLLDQFYDEGIGRVGVRIHLPVGRYVPEFLALDATGAEEPAPAPVLLDTAAAEPPLPAGPAEAGGRAPALRLGWRVWFALAAALLLLGALALVQLGRPPASMPVAAPQTPQLLVGRFANLTGTAALDRFSSSLSAEVADMLAPFEDFDARPAPSQAAGQTLGERDYLLSGAVNPAADGIEVTASLVGPDGEIAWTGAFGLPLPGPNVAGVVFATAARVIREIAPFRGPVHAAGRRWLDDQPRPLPGVSDYACLLTYRLARESGSSPHIADALACVERLIADRPDAPLATSMDAWLRMRAEVNRNPAESGASQLFADAVVATERAVAVLPESSLLHEHLGIIYNWQQRFDESAREYAAAIRLNPFNTDARAGYAVALARAGDWSLATRQAVLAIEGTAYPAPWYQIPLGVNALRERRFEDAIEAGRIALAYAGGEIGAVIAATAAAALGRTEVMEEVLPRLLNAETLRRGGILPWLGAQVADPEVLATMAAGLRRAGVPENALTGPF